MIGNITERDIDTLSCELGSRAFGDLISENTPMGKYVVANRLPKPKPAVTWMSRLVMISDEALAALPAIAPQLEGKVFETEGIQEDGRVFVRTMDEEGTLWLVKADALVFIDVPAGDAA